MIGDLGIRSLPLDHPVNINRHFTETVDQQMSPFPAGCITPEPAPVFFVVTTLLPRRIEIEIPGAGTEKRIVRAGKETVPVIQAEVAVTLPVDASLRIGIPPRPCPYAVSAVVFDLPPELLIPDPLRRKRTGKVEGGIMKQFPELPAGPVVVVHSVVGRFHTDAVWVKEIEIRPRLKPHLPLFADTPAKQRTVQRFGRRGSQPETVFTGRMKCKRTRCQKQRKARRFGVPFHHDVFSILTELPAAEIFRREIQSGPEIPDPEGGLRQKRDGKGIAGFSRHAADRPVVIFRFGISFSVIFA